MANRIKLLLFKFFDILKIEKKYLPVFFILVVLSAIFWTLTVLSKDYTSTIKYNVEFVDLPVKKLLVENKEVQLQLQVNAPGFTILAHKLKIRPNIKLSVSGFIPQKKGELWNYFWLGKQSLSEVQEMLPANMQLLHIQPSRIDLLLDQKSERTVPVKLISDFSFEQMFRRKGEVLLNPATITISGPKAVVAVINEVNTKSVSLADINADKKGVVELESINLSDVSFSNSEVNWNLEVEQFTEGRISLKIDAKNIPKGYTVKLFPDEVRLEYIVSLNNFEFVNPSDFSVYTEVDVDLNRLNVKLGRKNNFVENVRMVPNKVEYLLIKE
jgi:hypothetical protein